MVRVLIADDHPVFRFGLRTLLKADPAMEVVGEAVNGEDAIAQAASLHPDVILMDLNMPGMNGIEAIRRIQADHPQVHILALTMFDDDDRSLRPCVPGPVATSSRVLRAGRRCRPSTWSAPGKLFLARPSPRA